MVTQLTSMASITRYVDELDVYKTIFKRNCRGPKLSLGRDAVKVDSEKLLLYF